MVTGRVLFSSAAACNTYNLMLPPVLDMVLRPTKFRRQLIRNVICCGPRRLRRLSEELFGTGFSRPPFELSIFEPPPKAASESGAAGIQELVPAREHGMQLGFFWIPARRISQMLP